MQIWVGHNLQCTFFIFAPIFCRSSNPVTVETMGQLPLQWAQIAMTPSTELWLFTRSETAGISSYKPSIRPYPSDYNTWWESYPRPIAFSLSAVGQHDTTQIPTTKQKYPQGKDSPVLQLHFDPHTEGKRLWLLTELKILIELFA